MVGEVEAKGRQMVGAVMPEEAAAPLRHKAVRTVAARALDVNDFMRLLDILGLEAEEGRRTDDVASALPTDRDAEGGDTSGE